MGPAPVQPGGPPVFSGAIGPKATARAARWAAGISWFDFNLDVEDVIAGAQRARSAWVEAGRDDAPQFKVGCFTSLGEDARSTLQVFTAEYLAIFGRRFSGQTADGMQLHEPGVLADRLGSLTESGVVDEVILVPATVDPTCGSLLADLVSKGGY